MKIRILSGACYVLILVAFYLLKVYVHPVCFDVLLWLFALIGGYEIVHAFGDRMAHSQRVLSYLFAIFYLPAYVLCETLWGQGLTAMTALALLFLVLQLSLLVFDYANVTPEGLGLGLLTMLYPQLLLGVIALCNHLAWQSELAILFVFVLSPCADSVAYLFGVSLHKRFPRPMAPHISPNKTIVGGLGGLVGGVLGALVLYAVYDAVVGVELFPAVWQNLLAFGGVGLIGALFTAFGDLVESAIKRKVGLKDMGKIMPGHGGILDRIDGTLYLALLIYVVFVLFSL